MLKIYWWYPKKDKAGSVLKTTDLERNACLNKVKTLSVGFYFTEKDHDVTLQS